MESEGIDQSTAPVSDADVVTFEPVATQQDAGPTVDRDASSIRFIYPFTFDGTTMAVRSEAVTTATRPIGDRAHPVWDRQSVPTDDLLSAVADFVDPPSGGTLSAGFWRIQETVLRSPAGIGGGARHPGADWTLATRRGTVPFLLESIELALFQHGVGFLIVSATPASARLRDWFTFLHFFRFVGGRRASEVSATRTSARTDDGESPRTSFFPALADGRADSTQPAHVFAEVIDHLLATAATDGEGSRWWEEIFVPGMMLPHVALFIDNCPANDIGMHFHRLRNFFHADQTVHPSPQELALDAPELLPYAANQWFFYSLNGGGFLACDAPHTTFFRTTLPGHITGEYLLLCLLALEQRFVLMMLSQQVSRQWVGGEAGADEVRKVAAFTAIRDALLAFTAQGYFTQTMQEDHHHRSYAHWQDVFQLERMYRNVAEEVREMHGYLELRQRERADTIAREQQRQAENLDRRLTLVTWLLGIPVSLLLVINASGNIALVRGLVFGPVGVQAYDVLIGLTLDLLGITAGYITYRILDMRLRRRQAKVRSDGAPSSSTVTR